MKKYSLTIIISLVLGLLFSKVLFDQYDDKSKLKTVFGDGNTVYLVRQGIYSSLDSVKSNTMELGYYIYNIENDKYYVYVGITSNLENYDKIAGYLKNLGYDNYKTEIKINNEAFLESLEQYDLLLKETTDDNIIKAICSQVLASYEELVLNGGKN